MSWIVQGKIILLGVLWLGAPAWAASSEYQAEFYSFQGVINTGTESHTFARFTHWNQGRLVAAVDISWMPAPRFLRRGNRMPLLRTVPGRNYNLVETRAIAGPKPIRSHGSYAISRELYVAAGRRRAELESGRFVYKMLDLNPNDRAINCIHAVSGVLAFLDTGFSRGGPATDQVVAYFLRSGHMWAAGQVPRIGGTR